MSCIRIEGGVPLRGTVRVSGSKNGSLPLLAAALLVDGEVVFHNIPHISDIKTMIRMLRALGARVEHRADGTLVIDSSTVNSVSAPMTWCAACGDHSTWPGRCSRFGGPTSSAGGCHRQPVGFHIRGFRRRVEDKHGAMHAHATRLRGARIYMDPRLRSVGATVNIMLAATMAEGTTVIENASREPEVVDCQKFLAACGAQIQGIDTTTLRITGVERLNGVEWSAISDRMEAGTFLIAGALTRGEVTVEPIDPEHLRMVFDLLEQAGCDLTVEERSATLRMNDRPIAVDVMTAPYPGYPTDLQPNTGVLMSIARGASVVEETIFDARFNYVDELIRMGADVRVMDGAAIFKGVPQLSGAPVVATDIRAGAALILAGLAAEGVTEVSGGTLVDRGYEDITGKLTSLGARIEDGAGDKECGRRSAYPERKAGH